MKNAILLVGGGENPEFCWFPWLKKNLENRGFRVWLPELPHNDNPTLEDALAFVQKNGQFNEETVMVGHSAGCPLILSVLENLDIKIEQAIMVAGLIEPTIKNPVINEWQKKFIPTVYDWTKIKDHCRNFVYINAANDPWGCDDKQGRKMFDKLGGTLIINQEGHMGSEKFKQPYKEFPLLLKLIE